MDGLNTLFVMGLVLTVATSAYAASPSTRVDGSSSLLAIGNGRGEVIVSLASPEFVLGDEAVGGTRADAGVGEDVLNGRRVELRCPTISLREGTNCRYHKEDFSIAAESGIRMMSSPGTSVPTTT